MLPHLQELKGEKATGTNPKGYFKQLDQYGRNQEDWKKGALEHVGNAQRRNPGMS